MRTFKKRQTSSESIAGFIAKAVGVLFLFVLMVLSVRGAWDMYNRFASASEEARVSQAELASLKEREREIGAAVASFSSERGVEAEIRERYGVGRPGEGKIEIVRNTEGGETGIESQSGNMFFRIFQSLFVW